MMNIDPERMLYNVLSSVQIEIKVTNSIMIFCNPH